MIDLLYAALAYADAGIPVFPLVPKEKRPLTKNGVNDATTNIEQVKKWWKEHPEANVGIAMGNGVFGLDIDYKDGADKDFLKRIPPTVTTCTPNGGHHAFYKEPRGGIKNGLQLERGITARSKGYYFVAPPSVLSVGNYSFKNGKLGESFLEEAPEWIIEFNKKIVEEKVPFKLKDKIVKGEQHTTLFKFGSSLRAQGMSETEILAAFVAANERLEDPAPIENLSALASDICKRYEAGIRFEKYEDITAEELWKDFKEEPNTESKEPKTNEFPVDAMGPLLSNVTKIISEKTSTSIEMAANSVLAGVCLAIQEHYNVSAFGSIRPLSLYFVTVAGSGERKSTVDKLALKPHNEWRDEKFKIYEKEKEAYKSAMESYDDKARKNGIPKPICPKAPMLFASEPTMEGLFFCLKFHRNSIGLFSDEGGSWLSGHSMKSENVRGTLAKLNNLWDGSPIDRIRRGKDEGEIDMLYNKRVSSHLMIQPKLANELLGNEYAKSQGYLARCLICKPTSMIGRRKFLWDVDIKEEMKYYASSIKALLNQKTSDPVVLVPGNGVKEMVEKFHDEIEPLQANGGGYSFISEFASKLPEHCIRLAAMLEAFNNPGATEISKEWMNNAIQIGRFYLENHCKATAESSKATESDIEALKQTLYKRDTWKIRDVARFCVKRIRTKKALIPIIEKLHDEGFCFYKKESGTIEMPR